MFAKLTAAEIGRLRRFGQMKHYRKDEPLFVTGELLLACSRSRPVA
jgi:hypothetical protein